jgi:hypothetical protein
MFTQLVKGISMSQFRPVLASLKSASCTMVRFVLGMLKFWAPIGLPQWVFEWIYFADKSHQI